MSALESRCSSKYRSRRFGVRTTYVGKTRKCSPTAGSILISQASDAAVLTATVNSHICFTRHVKEKKIVLYLFPDGVF